MKRYLETQIRKDLREKMVFVGGPRQVGKTTLAKEILDQKEGYLNWDIPKHREMILRNQLPDTPFWVFDEIHKNRSWRRILKGLYDADPKQKILVTGSARLDYYRHGGDSLQGRYHYLRLHPLSLGELHSKSQKDLETLFNLGGFPEPFLKGTQRFAQRWSLEYRSRLIHDEVTSLEQTQDLASLELLMLRLPELVGSPLSINAIREDLQVAHRTASKWLAILERLYAIFRIAPFTHNRLRAVKKEQKHYHFDWSLVEEPALRFENLIASHLLKWVHFKRDTEGEDLELNYFRDVDKREVDFVILKKRKPIILLESKWKDSSVSGPLIYLKKRFPDAEAIQITYKDKLATKTKEGIRILPAKDYLGTLI